MEELTGLSRHKQNKIIQDLIEAKILFQENRGTPCRRFFKISFQEIENLVFKKTETSLLKIDKLDCKKLTNYSVKNSQTSLSKTDNNKEYIINNLNKELNHKEHNKSCDDCSDDLKAIKKWFKENKIDFSKKHEAKIIELLKINSLGYLLKLFQEQMDILKNKPGVKNIAGIFSNHLFKGTAEINLKEIENREIEQENLKNEEKKESENNEKYLEIFKGLSLEQQKKIELDILEKHKIKHFSELKNKSEFMYYRLISSFIFQELKEKGLI